MAGAGKPGKGRPMGRPRALLASDLGLAGPNNPTRTLKPLALRPYRSVGGKDYLRQQKAQGTGSFRLFAKGYMTQMEQYSNHLELRVAELETQLADKAAAADVYWQGIGREADRIFSLMDGSPAITAALEVVQ